MNLSFSHPETDLYDKNPNDDSSLRLSDLNISHSNAMQYDQSYTKIQKNEAEFQASLEQSNREIESLHNDIQALMMKAHIYCKKTGIASDVHSNQTFSQNNSDFSLYL